MKYDCSLFGRPAAFVVSLAVLVAVFNTGCTHVHNSKGLVNTIAAVGKTGVDRDRRTALLLLSELVLTPEITDGLIDQFEQEQEPLDRLLLAFVLYKRLQETRYANEFVDLYPCGKDQEIIWKLADGGALVIGPSPLQATLAELSLTDDLALEKLISGLPSADGWHAETLVWQIKRISKMDRKRVDKVMHKIGIDRNLMFY